LNIKDDMIAKCPLIPLILFYSIFS
jgi:hypothetical protein